MRNRKVRNGIPEPAGYKAFQIFNYILLTLISVFCMLPMINVLATSFSSAYAANAGIVRLTPVEFTTSAYQFVLENKDFWRSMLVSIKRVVFGGSISIALTILTAYPLSRDPEVFKQRKYYVWFIFVTMMFGGGLIPGFLIVKWTHLYNTIWALIVPGAISAWNCILMLNFFRQLPKELEEAAYIDGAGHGTILWKIIVPISKPVIATVLLFIMVGHWNDWFGGYLFMKDTRNYPMQTYLYSLLTVDITQMMKYNVSQEVINRVSKVNNKTLSAAQIFVGALPILTVYPFLQKYFTKGIVLGSVKG